MMISSSSRFNKCGNFRLISPLCFRMHQLSTSVGAVKGIKERAGKALKPGGSRYYVVDFTILYNIYCLYYILRSCNRIR